MIAVTRRPTTRLPGLRRHTVARPSGQAGPRGPGSDANRLPTAPALPRWLAAAAGYGAAGLILVVACWLILQLLLAVRVVTLAAVLALFGAALLTPLSRVLDRLGGPRWLAALSSMVLLLAVPLLAGLFIVQRARSQLPDLQGSLAAGVTQLRGYLTGPPLSLDSTRIDEIRDLVVQQIYSAVPDPVTSATIILEVLSTLLLSVFLLFFLLKDGQRMWAWVVGLAPERHRFRLDGAGSRAWWTLSRYIAGSVVIAFVDAVSIGLALQLLGVPLAVSLGLLIFFSSFVPLLGATLSGAAAVLVTLVSLGPPQALVVLGVVILVQQLEGNLLQPVVMGRAVRLHPVVILIAVSAGGLLGGIPGAVVAVPLTAVAYQVSKYLTDADHQVPPSSPTTS